MNLFDREYCNVCHAIFSTEIKLSLQKFLSSRLQESVVDKVQNFFFLFVEYIFSVNNSAVVLLRKELFEINLVKLWICNNCKINVQKAFTKLMCQLKSFPTNKFSESLLETEEGCVDICKCPTLNCKRIVVSLPNLLIYDVSVNKELSLPAYLNFSKSVDVSFPLNSMNYSLKAILCFDGSMYFAVLKQNDDFFLSKNKEKFNLKCLTSFKKIYLFYYKTVGTIENLSILKKKKIDIKSLPIMKITQSFTPEQCVHVKTYKGVRLTKSFYSSLTDKYGWLTSDHLNVYLHILSEKCTQRIHVTDSTWSSRALFRKGNPQQLYWSFKETESNISWLTYDFIVIPINQLNSHWTVVLINIKEKLIFYCNSYGNEMDINEKYVLFQIWRYLCFEALYHSNQTLDHAQWHNVVYSDLIGFPKQTDGSSCGVYVCGVVSAILSNSQLPFEPNLVSLHNSIATEISCI